MSKQQTYQIWIPKNEKLTKESLALLLLEQGKGNADKNIEIITGYLHPQFATLESAIKYQWADIVRIRDHMHKYNRRERKIAETNLHIMSRLLSGHIDTLKTLSNKYSRIIGEDTFGNILKDYPYCIHCLND